MERFGCRLPVLPVERSDLDGGQIDAVDATDVKGPSAWVEPRANERVDSTVLAEIVLRCFRIELIKGEITFAREDTKVCVCSRVPERTLATTNRAVAINDVVEFSSNLECNPTTMACALVGLNHLAFFDSGKA